jgi:hypothetical protein
MAEDPLLVAARLGAFSGFFPELPVSFCSPTTPVGKQVSWGCRELSVVLTRRSLECELWRIQA